MTFVETELPGVFIVEPKKIEDDRGFFSRVWCEDALKKAGLNCNIVQINSSSNKEKGTLRGLHYQSSPNAEVKILTCTRGSVFDVAVDMREDSKTFLSWIGVHLSEENRRFVYVPEGFAHGYQSTSDNAEVLYTSSNSYSPESENGIRWNDPKIDIEWPIQPINVSTKDQAWPLINGS